MHRRRDIAEQLDLTTLSLVNAVGLNALDSKLKAVYFDTKQDTHALDLRMHILEDIVTSLSIFLRTADYPSAAVEFLESLTQSTIEQESRLTLLEQAYKALRKTCKYFDVPESRLHHFMILRSVVKDLCAHCRRSEDRYALQIAEILFDALRFYYAENLNKTQLEVIEAVLHILKRSELSQRDAVTVDRMLVEAGLDSIPSGEE